MVSNIKKNDKRLKAFIDDFNSTLLNSNRYQLPGLGLFSVCTRKATPDRAACKAIMFRASAELKAHVFGGAKSVMFGSHAEVVQIIIKEMQCEGGIEIPCWGRMAVVPVSGKDSKLIFHAAKEIINTLENA